VHVPSGVFHEPGRAQKVIGMAACPGFAPAALLLEQVGWRACDTDGRQDTTCRPAASSASRTAAHAARLVEPGVDRTPGGSTKKHAFAPRTPSFGLGIVERCDADLATLLGPCGALVGVAHDARTLCGP